MLRRQTSEFSKVSQRFMIASFLGEPTGRFGSEQKTKAHNARRDELEAKGDAPDAWPGLDMLVHTVCVDHYDTNRIGNGDVRHVQLMK
jgi:hypothetical protein